MNTNAQPVIWEEKDQADGKSFSKSSAVAIGLHLLLLLIKFSAPPLPVEEPIEEKPITVSIVSMPVPQIPVVKPVVEEKKVVPPEVVKVPEKKPEVVAQTNKPVEKTEVPSANSPIPNAKPAPARLNPHHASAAPASPNKVANTEHPGPEVTHNGPETAKFRAKNDANKVAADSKGPGGPGKVGGDTGGGNTGEVPKYKGFNFKSAMGGMLAKGSGASSSGGRNGKGNGGYGFQDGSAFGSGIDKIDGTSDGAAPTMAKVSGNGVGKFSDAASGKIDGQVGAAGLVSKTGIMSATLPAGGTEVLGGMDPDAIRRALRESLPQFQHCYQKELETQNDASEGLVNLHFFIGANGRVSKSDVKGRSLANTSIQSCVLSVLDGIQFPEPPRSDSLVEVNQPLNFYASRK